MTAKTSRIWRPLDGSETFTVSVVLTAGATIILMSLGVITGVMAARLLGPNAVGELAAIRLWAGFSATLAMLGMPEALAFFSAREPGQAGRYIGSAVALALLASIVFALCAFWLMPYALAAQSGQTITTARWYLLLLPLTALMAIPLHALRGRGDFVAWNLLRLAQPIGWLVLLLAAWLMHRSDARFLAIGYLVILTLLLVPTLMVVSRRIAGPFLPQPRKWKPMLGYGMPSVLTNVPQMLNLRLDQMLMVSILPAKLIGLYVVAVAWSGAVPPLINALATVLFPRIASQVDPKKRAWAFAQGCRLAVIATIAIGCPVLVITPWITPLLFGGQYSGAIPAAVILVMAAMFLAINSVLQEGLRGLGKPAAALLAEAGGFVVTLLSLLILLRPFGIVGAALASVMGYIAVAVVLALQARKYSDNSWGDLFWPTYHDVTLILTKLSVVVRDTALRLRRLISKTSEA